MTDGSPEITVGISTYNRRDYLRKALDSLRAQTFRDFEVVVVDDGSSDGSGEMIRDEFPEVRYFFQENQGDAAAKNEIARRASGRYLVFLDSDDLFLPDALERLRAPLADDPGGCSYSQYIRIDSDGGMLPTRSKMKVFPSGMILGDLIEHIIVLSCATMMPLELFRRIGGHDVSRKCGHDWELALEMAARVNFHAVAPPVYLRRRHSSNLSAASYEKTDVLLRVMNDFAARHPQLCGGGGGGKYGAPVRRRLAVNHGRRGAEGGGESLPPDDPPPPPPPPGAPPPPPPPKYGAAVRRRLAVLHGRLASEAVRESLPADVARGHLRTALRLRFSFKNLFRLLIACLKR